MHYRIGSLTSMLGLSKNAIRHYERLGLVRPRRLRGNNYRSFDGADVGLLCKLRSFRSTGFSLEEIGEIFKLGSVGEVRRALADKQGQLARRMDELQAQADGVSCMLEQLEGLEERLGVCSLDRSPPLCWLPLSGEAASSVQRAAERAWIDSMPHVCISHMLRFEPDGGVSRADGYCVDPTEMASLGLPRGPGLRELPAADCLHLVYAFSLGETGEFLADWYRPLREWAAKQGVRPGNEALSYGIWSLGSGPDTLFFNELWLPATTVSDNAFVDKI